MRRFRFLLATSTVALAVLAPGAGAWAQGKPAGSQPPTPATSATAPKPGGTSATSAPKPGGAAPATSGTGSASSPKAPAGTGTAGSGAQTGSSPTTPGTGAATGTGTGTGAGAGAGAATGTGAATGAGAATGTGASGSAATGQPTDSAETLFRKGNDLAKKDNWKDAEPLYRAAWKLKQSYDIAANLGLALYQQKNWRESAEFLGIALRSFPASGKPENRALLESAFAAVKGEVGAVSVDVSVNGARVLVDGKEVGVSPLRDPVYVDPGKRTIEVTLEEYAPSKKTIDAAKGSSQAVKFVLTPKPRARPEVASGWKPPMYVYIAGGAAAAVGLGLGIGMTVAANGKSSHAAELLAGLPGASPCHQPAAGVAETCGEIKDSLKAQDTFSNVAVGGFVVGGALALGTAGLFVYTRMMKPSMSDEERASSASTSVRIIPVIGANERGLTLVGSW